MMAAAMGKGGGVTDEELAGIMSDYDGPAWERAKKALQETIEAHLRSGLGWGPTAGWSRPHGRSL